MAVGTQTGADVASEYATLQYIVQQILGRAQTLTLCRVVSCSNDGGIVPVGTLTVQPLVNLMTGANTAIKHKPLYNVPYVRISGGRNAVIIDPEPGDLGLVAFCSRDISAVKASKDIANPGSFRQFDYADGVYIAPCLGTEAPLQYLVMNAEGVRVVSPTAVEIQAPVVRIIGALEQSAGNASFGQNVAVTGTATAQEFTNAANIGLGTHKHPTAPTGPVSEPIP